MEIGFDEIGKFFGGATTVLLGAFMLAKKKGWFKSRPKNGNSIDKELIHLEEKINGKVNKEAHKLEIKHISDMLSNGSKRMENIEADLKDTKEFMSDIKISMAVLADREERRGD